MRKNIFASALALLLAALAGCSPPRGPAPQEVARGYVDLAETVFADALGAAERLQEAVDAFLASPAEGTLANARTAWRLARVPYAQAEAFRFAHPVVDAWEPQVNAWPLDEGFIDYVDGARYAYELGNPAGRANLIASETLALGGRTVELSPITADLLAGLNEAGGSEANVATGWHAIEFLLWGQDLHGTAPGAGERPFTDFVSGDGCTHGHCARRRDYLATVTQLLVNDLRFMHAQWRAGVAGNYREQFLALDSGEQLRRILYALGSLSLGELAGERMKVALFANSTEDEHDCFSDNTHATLFYNARGIANVLMGRYSDSAGGEHSFASVLDLAARTDPSLAEELREALAGTEAALGRLVAAAEEEGRTFDQLIAPGNTEGAAMIQAGIDALVVQTGELERLAAELDVAALDADDAGHRF